MPRKKQQKSIRKKQKRTILFYGEGASENVFLRHLKNIYANDLGIKITIKNGNGGSPDMVVRKAINREGDFGIRVVIVDSDRPEIEKAREIAGEKGIHLLENEPCLEALLLRILNIGKFTENKSSKYYKKEFEKKHICENKRCDIDEYAKIFLKKVLDSRRKEIGELDRMIGFVEKGR